MKFDSLNDKSDQFSILSRNSTFIMIKPTSFPMKLTTTVDEKYF